MLDRFQPVLGTQTVVVDNTPFTLTQTVEGEPWNIVRGGTVLGQLYREDDYHWGVWPMLDGCTLVKQALTPGDALRQAL